MVRIKHRYLLLNILYPNSPPQNEKPLPWAITFRRPSPTNLTPQLLIRIIRDNIAELFGDYGAGMVAGSLQVKYISQATSTAIVRVTRAHYRLVWAALSYITGIPSGGGGGGGRGASVVEEKCVVQVVRVSGTIKKVEEEAVRLARRGIVRARKAPTVEEEDDDEREILARIDSEASGDEG